MLRSYNKHSELNEYIQSPQLPSFFVHKAKIRIQIDSYTTYLTQSAINKAVYIPQQTHDTVMIYWSASLALHIRQNDFSWF